MNSSLANIVGALLATLLAQILLGTTHGQLTAQDASEGSCLPVAELMPHLYSGVNLFAILPPGDYYIPMASQALYREYAEGLLGRPAATQEELDAMNLVLKCGPIFTTIQNKGFPHMKQPPSFAQTCAPLGIPTLPNLGLTSGKVNLDYVQAACVGLPAKRPNGTLALRASQSFTFTMDSVIWVNKEETAFLIYRCPSNNIKDYKVVTKTKTISDSDVAIIREKIAALGFQQDHVAFLQYE